MPETEAPLEDASVSKSPKLSDAQKARIEKNRQRALLLRQARLTGIKRNCPEEIVEAPSKIRLKKNETVGLLACEKDTGAGFFLEDDDDDDIAEAVMPCLLPKDAPPAILGGVGVECVDCGQEFSNSMLLRHYDVPVCDGCRDSDEKHKLCTKTEAKQFYLLKDCDLDSRKPVLKYVLRKNPHNERWGQMKLYYKPHIIARAVEVWGSLDRIEEEKEKRVDNKEQIKQKRYEKRIKELRRAVRTSTWKKTEEKHEHEYDSDNETYDEEKDEYSKQCKTCGHILTYEKM